MKILIESTSTTIKIYIISNPVYKHSLRQYNHARTMHSDVFMASADIAITYNCATQTFSLVKDRYGSRLSTLMTGFFNIEIDNENKIIPSADATWFVLAFQTPQEKYFTLNLELGKYNKIVQQAYLDFA